MLSLISKKKPGKFIKVCICWFSMYQNSHSGAGRHYTHKSTFITNNDNAKLKNTETRLARRENIELNSLLIKLDESFNYLRLRTNCHDVGPLICRRTCTVEYLRMYTGALGWLRQSSWLWFFPISLRISH